jgi:hypothetical protein
LIEEAVRFDPFDLAVFFDEPLTVWIDRATLA